MWIFFPMGMVLWNPQALGGWSEYVQWKSPLKHWSNLWTWKQSVWEAGPELLFELKVLASLWKLVATLSHSVLLTCVVFFPHAVTYTNVKVIFACIGQWVFRPNKGLSSSRLCSLSNCSTLGFAPGKERKKGKGGKKRVSLTFLVEY